MTQRLSEAHIGKSVEELSAEQEALAKVINFDEAERNALVGGDIQKSALFHVPGFNLHKDEDRLVAGILLSEQVLTQGLLSKQMRDRAGVAASSFGHSPESPFVNGTRGISTYKMFNFRHSLCNGLGDVREGDFSGRSFAFIVRPVAKDILHSEQTSEDEVILGPRVKPKDIIGIYSREIYINENLRDLLLNAESTLNLAQQLLRVAGYLGIEITDDVWREIFETNKARVDEIREKVAQKSKALGVDGWQVPKALSAETQGEIERIRGDLIARMKRIGVEGSRIQMFSSADTRTMISNWMYYRQKEYERIAGDEAKKRVLPLIFGQERFKDIRTVGDYLKFLGKEFRIPIYIDEKLYWPEN